MLGYVIVSFSKQGNLWYLRIIPLHIDLEQGNFIYINTDNAVLCFDGARQYYILMDEAELEVCKTVSKGSQVCNKDIRYFYLFCRVLRCEDAQT